MVHGHTEGNPFFATEIARLLEGPGTGYRVPDSVKGALARRMDRLSDLANQLLVAASVIGREFELEVLERTLASSDRGAVLRAVEEALHALIIEPAPLDGERYQFRHALIRDALYEDLSPCSQREVACSCRQGIRGNAGRPGHATALPSSPITRLGQDA